MNGRHRVLPALLFVAALGSSAGAQSGAPDPRAAERSGLGLGVGAGALRGQDSGMDLGLDGRGIEYSVSWTLPRHLTFVARGSTVRANGPIDPVIGHLEAIAQLRPGRLGPIDPFVEIGATRRTISTFVQNPDAPVTDRWVRSNTLLALGVGTRLLVLPSLQAELGVTFTRGAVDTRPSGWYDVGTRRFRAALVWLPPLGRR